ncbi:glyoxylate/hydroxypyruvate reductase A [Anabrus simplex]|uniref:glyoxylate/hydroxypyruvate reductase A n=1 Tax=Anabrus simplex TaxID=316456 RepID=UPI0034DDB9E3
MYKRNMSPHVAVFSNIPKLTTCLKNAMPNIHFREVTPGCAVLNKQFSSPGEVSDDSLKVLQESEIIIGDFNIMAPVLDQLPNVKWLQGTWAGADTIFKTYDHNKPRLPYVITRFSGSFFGNQMSEYVVAHIVNRERCFFSFYDSQKAHKWEKNDLFPFRRSIQDLTIGILGTGVIGKSIAKVLKTLHATVWGLGRTPLPEGEKLPNIDEYRLVSKLPELLQNCDYVINVLPDTKETTGLLSGDILHHCAHKQSVLINIGRGNVYSEEDLLKALKEGWLSGAILDVFSVEPLPANSPLWDMKQVTISPHIAGITRPQDVAKVFKENYERFKAGKPLLHVLDLEKGY